MAYYRKRYVPFWVFNKKPKRVKRAKRVHLSTENRLNVLSDALDSILEKYPRNVPFSSYDQRRIDRINDQVRRLKGR